MPSLLVHPVRKVRELWLKAFHTYSSTDPVAGEIRAAHLSSVVRQTPLTMLANLVNATVVCLAFVGKYNPLALGAWAGALVVMSVLGIRAARRAVPRSVSPRAIRRAALHAGLLGALWAVTPIYFFPDGDTSQQLVVATLITGMLCGGAFALFAVPLAAVAYVSVLGAASVYALLASDLPASWLVAAMLMAYGAVIIAGVLWGAQLATARLLSERDASRQGQLVTMLLRDFEENAADVLWEVDGEQRFTHASPRLCALLGRTAEELTLTTLTDVVDGLRPLDDRSDGRAALRSALLAERGFRNVILDVELRGVRRWWAVRAKAIHGADGRRCGWRGVITDVTDEREAHDRLAYLAHYDALTGLANRVRLRECVTRALEQAEQRGTRSAMLCLDVDNFKSLNDTLGTSVGDGVLQAVAKRILGCVDSRDVAARLGGDEFAVLIQDVPGDERVHVVARRILESLSQPVELFGRKVQVGISIGIAFMPDHGATLDELLASADLALEAAKDAGRGRLEVFAPQLGEKSRRKQSIERALRDALSQDALEIHWQPKVDTNTWRVAAAEALLRWRHPTLGPISPAEFIPIAEASGLIDSIGEWVLRTACRQAARELPGICIAVNVSPAQFLRPDFLDSVSSALLIAGLEPGRLEVEVTESLFMGEVPIALGNLHGLRKLGVRVALDDFGTGYSSLAYLRRFPFDTLKIDRAFVRELMVTKDARAIVGMIIQLAETLGMDTVAEGVEDEAQLDALSDAGCHVIQGFLFAKPMPLADLKRFIDRFEAPPNARRGRVVDLVPEPRLSVV